MRSARLLIVETDEAAGAPLEERLGRLGYAACTSVTSAARAVEAAATDCFDLALIDLGAGGRSCGVEAAERLGECLDVPMVYLTDGIEAARLHLAGATTPYGCVLKPVDARQLHLTIQTALSLHGKVTRQRERDLRRAEVELKQRISALQEEVQLMETVFEGVSDGVIVAKSGRETLIANSSAKRMIDAEMMAGSQGQGTGQNGIFRVDKKTPFPTGELPLLRAVQGEPTDDLELFVRSESHPEGVFISVNGRPFRLGAQGPGSGVITFRDVTTRKLAESDLQRAIGELRDQNELLEATFNSVSDGLVVINPAGEVLSANPVARQIAGVDMMDPSRARLLINWGPYYYPDRETLIPPDDLALNRAIFHGEAVGERDMFVRNHIHPDGVCIRANARPLLHVDGSIRGGVVIFRDVTQQMRAEEALTQAFAHGRLEIVDTILHNIGNAITSVTVGIDTLSHALSDNPLLPRFRALADAIKGHQDDWVDYVRNDPQGQKVMPFVISLAEDFTRHHAGLAKTVARVRGRARHIADIVRTQKTFDSPHMVHKDIDLKQALLTAAGVLHDALERRGFRVEIQRPEAPRRIHVRESQFHQMLVNLLKNAMEAIDKLAAANGLKEAARIRIRTYTEGDYLHIDVMDNGIGIDSKNGKIIFAAGYTTKKSGNGLGLHSAANFVIGMGGQIVALSDGIGKGATLRVMLRLASVTPPPRNW